MNKRSHTRTLLVAVGIGGAAAMAGLAAAPAHADPVTNYVAAVGDVVCEALDLNPTFSGIENAAKGIVADTGWDYEHAGEVIKYSVIADCIRNAPLWNRFVATYGPQSSGGDQPPAPQEPARTPMQRAV